MITQNMIEDALRYIGIKGKQADEEIRDKVKSKLETLSLEIQPKSLYQIFAIEKYDETIHLVGTSCDIISKDLRKVLQYSERCYILAATLGMKLEQEISKCQRLNMLEAVILDACSSVLIDKVCDDIELEIMKTLTDAEYLTMRFSPGYGDVPLEVSRDIIEILNANKRIGLLMTQTNMLLPSKSITAIIGISSQKENRARSCKQCNLVSSCLYRGRGERCGL